MYNSNHVIYKHTNLINGKSYIGYTSKGLEARWNQHINDSNKNKQKVNKFHEALRQYSKENWNSQVLFVCLDIKFLKQMEVVFIEEYQTHLNGYNSNKGGSGVPEHSESTKVKLKNKRKGRTPNLGNVHSEETKKRFSETRKGEGNSMFGNTHSEESKLRMSVSAKKRWESSTQENPNARTWKVTDPQGVEFIFRTSLQKFCDNKGISMSALRAYVDRGPVPIYSSVSERLQKRVRASGWSLANIS